MCRYRQHKLQQYVWVGWIVLLFAWLGCKAESQAPPDRKADSTNVPGPALSTETAPAIPLPLAEQLRRDGWIRLFDGETLFGWTPTGNVDWEVVDQTIRATQGEIGFLHTTTMFSDYILQLQFRCDEETNSGVFLHMPLHPQDPTRDCYEVNIAPPDNPFPTGSLVGRQRVEPPGWQDGWFQLEIQVDGPHIRVKLDEGVILEYQDPSDKFLGRGHIGLQHNQGRVQFRDIRLKPLNAHSLFSGRDLAGWTVKPGLDSEFSVTSEGHMQVIGGKGQIETEGEYDNFVLHVDCQTGAVGLNSGIFFRCIPGDFWMGYESQIHNGYAGGDRTNPIDCGTGGIFRRQDARRVVADDLQWFTKTIVADGPHLAVWVNGYQVSDWIDTRPPHENPRNGRRMAAGTIILQGHDPTTNLLFSNFLISPLRQRAPDADL